MERHAYLIMAHNQWDVLCFLLKSLDDERNDIYLHIDKKIKTFPKDKIVNSVHFSNLYFTKRYDIVWGGTQMMECELQMLKEACCENYNYYHLLSGVDMPLKSQDYIHKFFDENDGKEYVSFDWNGIHNKKYEERVNYYHFFVNKYNMRSRNTMKSKILSKLDYYCLIIQKKVKISRLKKKIYYKGSSWFSITGDLAKNVVADKEALCAQYKYTIAPEEGFLQTYIMSSKYKDLIGESNKRFIEWSDGNSSPNTITMQMIDKLKNTDKIFARKFDSYVDSEIIYCIEQMIKN